MADITVPRGDKGYYLNFTVTNADGTAFNLTGYTITIKVWPPNSDVLLMSGTCSIVVAASGTCRYFIAANDFTRAGLYNCELELTQSGVIESTKTYSLQVADSPA